MSWIHSSKTAVVLVFLVVLVGATGTAAARDITISGAPDEAEVGSEVTATITIDDAYTEDSQWTLETETELENVSWTVEEFDQNNRVEQWTGGNQTFSQDVSSEPSGDEIRIEITGDVPALDEPSYEPAENVTLVAVKSTTGSNTETLQTYTVHHYTAASKEARTAIDDAQTAIDDAGGDQEASDRLDEAISAYENSNYELAKSIASDAEETAKQTKQSQQTNQLVLYGGIGAVVLIAVVGGVLYWRNQGDDYDKLR